MKLRKKSIKKRKKKLSQLDQPIKLVSLVMRRGQLNKKQIQC
jgi:hypothetical protein